MYSVQTSWHRALEDLGAYVTVGNTEWRKGVESILVNFVP